MTNHASEKQEIFRIIRLVVYAGIIIAGLFLSKKYEMFKTYPVIPAAGTMIMIAIIIMDGVYKKKK